MIGVNGQEGAFILSMAEVRKIKADEYERGKKDGYAEAEKKFKPADEPKKVKSKGKIKVDGEEKELRVTVEEKTEGKIEE